MTYEDHINKIRNNIARLKKDLPEGTSLKEAIESDILKDTCHSSDSPNMKTQDVVYSLFETSQGLSYMDLTGRFPYKSSKGNEYILVEYSYDINAILA